MSDQPDPAMQDFEPIASAIRDYWKRWGWARTAGFIGSVLMMIYTATEARDESPLCDGEAGPEIVHTDGIEYD